MQRQEVTAVIKKRGSKGSAHNPMCLVKLVTFLEGCRKKETMVASGEGNWMAWGQGRERLFLLQTFCTSIFFLNAVLVLCFKTEMKKTSRRMYLLLKVLTGSTGQNL